MMYYTLESIYVIYIPECSYYTNKHLLNSIDPACFLMVGSADLWDGGLVVWNQCHFAGCCRPLETPSALGL